MRAISNIDHPLRAHGRLRLTDLACRKNPSTFIFVPKKFMAGINLFVLKKSIEKRCKFLKDRSGTSCWRCWSSRRLAGVRCAPPAPSLRTGPSSQHPECIVTLPALLLAGNVAIARSGSAVPAASTEASNPPGAPAAVPNDPARPYTLRLCLGAARTCAAVMHRLRSSR